LGRFGLELIRTDTTFRLLGLSRNGWVSLGVVVGAGAWLYLRERRGPAAPEPVTVPAGGPEGAREPAEATADASEPERPRDEAEPDKAEEDSEPEEPDREPAGQPRPDA
jgi:hypothetical protein